VRRIGVAAFAGLTVVSLPAASAPRWGAQAEAPVTKDRLSPERMDALVAGPMAVLKTSGLDAAQKAFEALVADTVRKHGKGTVREADLLTAFGVALDLEGINRDDQQLERAAAPYIERAIPAYRAAFGPRHPEVALALNSYATLIHNFHDKALDAKAEAALVEAISIRIEKLGPENSETKTAQAELAMLRDRQDTELDVAIDGAAQAVDAAEEAVAATAPLTTGDKAPASASGAGTHALWKPLAYSNALIDEFSDDAKDLAPGVANARKREVARKYGLSVAALDEGLALIGQVSDNWFEDRRKAALRARALRWFQQSNRAPIALAYTGAILDQVGGDGGCSAADLNLLMKGSRDPDADLWSLATTCSGSAVYAAAIDRSARARPAVQFLALGWTSAEPAAELAATDTLLRPEWLAQVDAAHRDAVTVELARRKLDTLLGVGLTGAAIALGDSLPRPLLAAALKGRKADLHVTIGGFLLKDAYVREAVAVDYAAALALSGRASDARWALEQVAPRAKLKEARACLEAVKDSCDIGRGGIPLAALIVHQLLDDPAGDPYVLSESAAGEYPSYSAPVAEALCHLLTQSAEQKECSTVREAADRRRNPDIEQSTADRALWASLARAGGEPFAAARARYAALLPKPLEKAKETDWSRASVDPERSGFLERPITPALVKKTSGAGAGSEPFAALPNGYALIRRERSGERAVAISVSTRFDPNGEVSGGGYWVHLSDDGGKSWGPPLYTGLAEHFPYIVPARSRLPLLAGDHLRLEVQESLIDTASISYPPVGLHIRRKRSGLYLDIPLADLSRDSDGDGLTDIAAHHLLLDRKSAAATPFVAGQDRDCTARPDTVARLEILKTLFAVEARALIEPPDKQSLIGDWRRVQPTGKPPIFLVGDPAEWRCVVLDRPMIVYSDADREQLRKFSPDFQLTSLPEIRWNRAHTRGFVQWSMQWTGGTYRITRKGDGWDLKSIRQWIT